MQLSLTKYQQSNLNISLFMVFANSARNAAAPRGKLEKRERKPILVRFANTLQYVESKVR